MKCEFIAVALFIVLAQFFCEPSIEKPGPGLGPRAVIFMGYQNPKKSKAEGLKT